MNRDKQQREPSKRTARNPEGQGQGQKEQGKKPFQK
jgi:hypothetical protein